MGGNSFSVRNIIEATALDIENPGWDIYTGSGLIQMDAAIQQLTPMSTHSQAPTHSFPLSGLYFPTASPTLTLASSLTPVPASVTVTVSATESASTTPTFTATASPTIPAQSAASRFEKIGSVSVRAVLLGSIVPAAWCIITLADKTHANQSLTHRKIAGLNRLLGSLQNWYGFNPM
jgi:hypothetical protein